MALRDRWDGLKDTIRSVIADRIVGADELEKARARAQVVDRAPASQVPPEDTPEELMALMADPYALVETLGYRERYSPLSYDVLNRMAYYVPIYPTILQTRRNQVASFCAPQTDPSLPGFRIGHRDRKRKASKKDQLRYHDMEEWMVHTGSSRELTRDTLDGAVRKLMRDSLIFDQMCHPPGTLVELGNGTVKPIEEVQVGDMVRTHRGRVRRVTELKRRKYTGEMVKAISGGESLSMTAGHPTLAVNHPWFRMSFYRGKIKPEWIEAKDLSDQSYLTYPRPKVDGRPVSFEIFKESRKYSNVPWSVVAERANVHPRTAYQIISGAYTKNGPAVDRVKRAAQELDVVYESLDRPAIVEVDRAFGWLCGLYVAEGNPNKGATNFTLHEEEMEVAARLAEILGSLGVSITFTDVVGKAAIAISANSVELRKFLEEHFGGGSQAKRVPEWMINATSDVREGFAEAYLIGDGCDQGSTNVLATTSIQLFHGMRVVLASLGIFVRKAVTPEGDYDSRSGIRHNAEKYSGCLSGPGYESLASASHFLDYVKPKRSHNAYISDEEFFYQKVWRVEREQVEELDVFNFEVEEDHSYIANGFVSHNCLEKVRNKKGIICNWHPVDGSSIRIADSAWKGGPKSDSDVQYVQVHDETVIAEFTPDQLCFAVRNPRSDLRANGYGESELEIGLKIATALINGWHYNSKFFENGTVAKGMLNIPRITGKKLRIFARQFHMMTTGMVQAWRTPLTNFEDAKWIDLDKSRKDMEWSEFINFCIKLFAGICLMDPAELHFQFGNTGQTAQMFQAPAEEKIKYSKDKGLRPLLAFLASQFNRHLIWQIDPDMCFYFTGLDPRESEKAVDIEKKQVTYLKTVNQMRIENDDEPLSPEEGDIILDPTWMQNHMALRQETLQREQMAQDQEMAETEASAEPEPEPKPNGKPKNKTDAAMAQAEDVAKKSLDDEVIGGQITYELEW